jgi:hypothetical protein
MGIRKSRGKNKKNKRVIGAIAVKRDETLRRADKGSVAAGARRMRERSRGGASAPRVGDGCLSATRRSRRLSSAKASTNRRVEFRRELAGPWHPPCSLARA